MFAIVTSAKLVPDSIDTVVELFEETNPPIVRAQPDWRGARMLVDRGADAITVIALWTDVASYRGMAGSAEFRETMQRFSPYFAEQPTVSVTEVAVEMTPESVRLS